MRYHLRSSIAFRVSELGYEQRNDIAGRKEPILLTGLCLGTGGKHCLYVFLFSEYWNGFFFSEKAPRGSIYGWAEPMHKDRRPATHRVPPAARASFLLILLSRVLDKRHVAPYFADCQDIALGRVTFAMFVVLPSAFCRFYRAFFLCRVSILGKDQNSKQRFIFR
jgi:hypothetical protein